MPFNRLSFKSILHFLKPIFLLFVALVFSINIAYSQSNYSPSDDKQLETLMKQRPLTSNQKTKLKARLKTAFMDQIEDEEKAKSLDPKLKSTMAGCASEKVVNALWASPEFRKSFNGYESVFNQDTLKLSMKSCLVTAIGQDMVNNPEKYVDRFDGNSLSNAQTEANLLPEISLATDNKGDVQTPLTEEYKQKLRDSIEIQVREKASESYDINQLSEPVRWQLYSCASKKLTEVVWYSKEYRATRSQDAIKSPEDFEKAFKSCGLTEPKPQTQAVVEKEVYTKPISYMPFNDLYVDFNGLVGETVSVRGFLIASGDTSVMTQKIGASAMLFVDTVKLSRQERRELLRKCSQGCDIGIEGVVSLLQYQKGITATKVHEY